MSKEDHHMILEIIFHHAFVGEKSNILDSDDSDNSDSKDKLEISELNFSLFSLMMDFLGHKYDEIKLDLDWKPIYNTLYTFTSKKRLHSHMMTFSDNYGNIYNKLENI